MVNVKNIFVNAKRGLIKRSPEILTGIGIAGMATATVMAVKATPKALSLIDEKKHQIEDEEHITVEELTAKETIEATWKCYIPAGITFLVSTACLIGASSVNHKRNTALAAAYTLTETTLKDYQKKVVEVIGEKKEQTIKDAVAKEHLDNHPVENKEVIILGGGSTLCFDTISGRYFKSDIDTIKKVENALDARLRNEMYISLNEFYYELGLEPLRKIGDDIGWNIDNGYLDISFSSQLATDGTPCLVIDYGVSPRYDYRTLM